MSINRVNYIGLILAAAAVLNGCGSDSVWKCESFSFATPTDPPAASMPTNLFTLHRVTVSPLYQSQSFIYRTSENGFERDPYARFLISPERALGEPMRAWARDGGAFGHLIEPGSSLIPSIVAEASVNELYGDFRSTNQLAGVMTIHFTVYNETIDGPGPVLLDKVFAVRTPMTRRTPAALMAAWDTDLRQIMEELNSDYAKAHSTDR